MKKIKYVDKIVIIIGSLIVAFAISNIHSRFNISEGGQLGIELLLYNWFNISPAVTSFVIDFTLYIIGFLILGKRFLINAVIGTLSYSFFYFIFQNMPYLIPDFFQNMLFLSIMGGVLVGIGCGMVVKMNGACGGDDSLALILSNLTGFNIFICYFFIDLLIILFSLTYIDIYNIGYSLLTALISSLIIDYIYRLK